MACCPKNADVKHILAGPPTARQTEKWYAVADSREKHHIFEFWPTFGALGLQSQGELSRVASPHQLAIHLLDRIFLDFASG
jgi:hypothetical protein